MSVPMEMNITSVTTHLLKTFTNCIVCPNNGITDTYRYVGNPSYLIRTKQASDTMLTKRVDF